MRIVTSAIGTAIRPIAIVFAITMGLSLPSSVVRAADVVVTTDADSGAGSLREAIDVAASGDVIVFDIPVPAPVITLATPLPQLSGDISFRNDGAASVVIDRNGTTAWEFSGGTIDPTGLNFVDGAAPSIDADIIATADTTLIGDAILNGNLTSPGTIAPGASAVSGSIGTFEVSGDFDASSSTVEVDVESAGAPQSDLIRVGGNATLTDAILSPTFTGDAFVAGQTFTIVEAGSIVGTFANASDVYAFPSNPFLEATENTALPANQFGFLIQDNGASFQTVVTGCNQTSAAMVLDELQALGTVPAVTDLRNGSEETVTMAVDQLSGSIYPSLIGAEINHIQNNLASVRDRVALHGIGAESIEKVFWARGYGVSGKVERDDCQTVGYLQRIGGLELGAGLRGVNGWAIYSFAHLADSQINTREVRQQADVSSYRIGGLVEYQGENAYLIAAGGAGTQDYEVRRWLDAFEGSSFTESSFDGTTQFGYLELGKVIQEQYCDWGPYFGVQASRVDLDPISETGDANFALTTNAGDGESYRSVLGLSLSQSGWTALGPATTRLRFGWMHEYGNESEIFESQLATPTVTSLEDRGVSAGRDWGFVRVQVDMGVFLGGQFTTSYLGQYNSQSSMNTGLLGLHWTF